VLEHYRPKLTFTKLFLDFCGGMPRYTYFLHKIILNIFAKKFLVVVCFLIELIKEDVQNVLLLLARKP